MGVDYGMKKSDKILLHVCCAPCATSCVERLLLEKRDVTLYFSNSNINTEEEFEKRLHYVKKLASFHDLPLEIDPYRHSDWLDHIQSFESEPEKGMRCVKCFDWSFGRTAAKANELGIANFATTLTVSPHKISKVIFETGAKYEGFEEYDFKKKDGFRRSLELTKEYEFYRQNFCGCEFSIR